VFHKATLQFEDGSRRTVPVLVAQNPEVLEVVQRSGLGERLGRERMYFSLEQAVESYQKQFGDPK